MIYINLKDIDKKEHKLYFLYPIASFLLTKTGLEKRLLNKSDISEKIRALHVSDNREIQIRLYWYQKISLILVIIFAFSSFSFIASIQSAMNKSDTFEGNLIRPEEGEGDRKIKLRFRMAKQEDGTDIYEDEIIINNKERVYTQDEWEGVLKKVIPYLEEAMLGENEAADNVNKNLNFIQRIPNTAISIEWIPKDYRLISGRGELKNTDMTDAQAETLVTAILKYNNKRVEHTIPLTIRPAKLDEKEILYRELEDALDTAGKETAAIEEWNLPGQIGEYSLTWKTDKKNRGVSLLILGLLGAVLIGLYGDRELDSRMRRRKNQMLLDYPEIINKFVLLINAGMTIKQAWSKIAEDYEKKSRCNKREIRYAYEEMRVTCHELKLGISEAKAYGEFGKRAGLLSYMKFSSILVQNLKKGNRNMVDLLKQEAIEAFQERKETTKKLGEEASTKLLVPMMIMLLIVLIIIMIPAFISFRI